MSQPLQGQIRAHPPCRFAARPDGPPPVAHAQVAGVTTPSGLIFESLKEGIGASPAATDTVKVHYCGAFAAGPEFDNSHKRGEPTEFPLNRVIPCGTEGAQRMKPGGEAKLTCPPLPTKPTAQAA